VFGTSGAPRDLHQLGEQALAGAKVGGHQRLVGADHADAG
jgi:hypothetical protein